MRTSYPKSPRLAKPSAEEFSAALSEALRHKASEVLQAYLDAEVDELLGRARHERRVDTDALGYRDGHEPPRTIASGAVSVTVRRPRVRGSGEPFESAVLPKYRRRLPQIDKALHELWIQGLAQRDFEPALRGLLGQDAPLSPSTIGRVNAQFQTEYTQWRQRRLDDTSWVYAWADGIHLGAGPDDERRVLLVVIGADVNGHKHLLALDEAMSESETAWRELFADLRSRGMNEPAVLVGDGANGLWVAATTELPATTQQRCWVHKLRNVLDKVPEKLVPSVHSSLRRIMHAPSEAKARRDLEELAFGLQRDYPKAATCLRDDVDRLLTYHRFPQAHHKHLRTTNVVESPFDVVRTRTNACKRLRTGASATYLVYALLVRQATRWRKLDGYQLLAGVVARINANALDKTKAA